MKNKGHIVSFVVGAILGVVGFLLTAWLGVYLFRDKLVEKMEDKLLAPPIPAMLKADYSWEVVSDSGEQKSLATLEGQVAIVHLFSPDCLNCLAEWPSIVSLYNKTQDLGVPIICIAIAKTEKLSDFVAEHKPPFPVYAKTDPVPEMFSMNSAPVTFIYDKKGNIAFKHSGSAKWDDDSVVEYLKQLSGETAAPKTPEPVAEATTPKIPAPVAEAPKSAFPYVDPATLEGVVMDNDQATLTGTWTPSNEIGPFVGKDYLRAVNDSGAMASYAPTLPKRQFYKVLVSYSAAVDCASNTYVLIQAADGSHLYNVEQRTYADVVGPFFEVGEFEFDTTGGIVEIRADGANGIVVADAVQWIPVQ